MKKTKDDKLKYYKIPQDRYQRELGRFTKLEYTESQADRVILRQSSKQTCEYLIANHQKFMEKHFSRPQVIRMAAHQGGGNNLYKVLTSFDDLTSSGSQFKFDKDQIVRMVSYNGSSKNLEAVLNHQEKLIDLGFNLEQIVDMASDVGGSVKLNFLVDNAPMAQRLGVPLPTDVQNNEMRNEYKLKLSELAMEHQRGVERVRLELFRELFPDSGNPVPQDASTEPLEPPAKRARMEGPDTFFAPFHWLRPDWTKPIGQS